MSNIVNIKVIVPRMISYKQAADYVGIPLKRFQKICPVQPVAMPDHNNLFDVRDLDTWLDHIKIGSATSDEKILERLG